jgi:hypothetical protein
MKASTVFLLLLGLVIAAMGAVFTSLMWDSYRRAAEMRAWPQTEAVILASELEERLHDDFSPKEYRLRILYGYEWEGERKTGEQWSSRGNPWSNKREVPARQLERFPAGARSTVYINPENPDFTVLQPDSKAAGYSIWFPALFVIGGVGIMFHGLRSMRPAKSVD